MSLRTRITSWCSRTPGKPPTVPRGIYGIYPNLIRIKLSDFDQLCPKTSPDNGWFSASWVGQDNSLSSFEYFNKCLHWKGQEYTHTHLYIHIRKLTYEDLTWASWRICELIHHGERRNYCIRAHFSFIHSFNMIVLKQYATRRLLFLFSFLFFSLIWHQN